MSEAFQYIANLSPWAAIPIVLVTLFVTLWPKIYQVFLDLNADHRAFHQERRRLELLKLRYEIEALRKSHDLAKIPVEQPSAPIPAPAAPATERRHSLPLPIWQRFSFGAIGALIPSVYRILISAAVVDAAAGTGFLLPSLGYYIGVVLLCIIGGLAASFVPRERASPFLCVMVGLSIVLIIQMGVALPQSPVQVSNV